MPSEKSSDSARSITTSHDKIQGFVHSPGQSDDKLDMAIRRDEAAHIASPSSLAHHEECFLSPTMSSGITNGGLLRYD